MSTGDFGIELQQSVQAHLEAIEAMAREAKARIASDVEAVQPASPPLFEQGSTPKRYNISFDDAFEPTSPAPIIAEPPQADAAFDPVWEDPP